MTATKGLILLVENDRFMREAIEDILGSVGIGIISVGDGQEGVDAYLLHPGKIDLVMLDMRLPGMGGAEVLQKLRAINTTVKAIITSGLDEQEVYRKIPDQENVIFLKKPYKADDLLETVKRLLI